MDYSVREISQLDIFFVGICVFRVYSWLCTQGSVWQVSRIESGQLACKTGASSTCCIMSPDPKLIFSKRDYRGYQGLSVGGGRMGR